MDRQTGEQQHLPRVAHILLWLLWWLWLVYVMWLWLRWWWLRLWWLWLLLWCEEMSGFFLHYERSGVTRRPFCPRNSMFSFCSGNISKQRKHEPIFKIQSRFITANCHVVHVCLISSDNWTTWKFNNKPVPGPNRMSKYPSNFFWSGGGDLADLI